MSDRARRALTEARICLASATAFSSRVQRDRVGTVLAQIDAALSSIATEPDRNAALTERMQKIVDLWPGYEANGMQMSDYAYEAFSIARAAIAATAATKEPT